MEYEQVLGAGGNWSTTIMYESFYIINGAGGTVWYSGQQYHAECNTQGVKEVTVRALANSPWVSVSCSGGN